MQVLGHDYCRLRARRAQYPLDQRGQKTAALLLGGKR
jgi:hypothetical protein